MALLDSVALMDTLRRNGPWESTQTHHSLRRYLLEEVYELLDAIETLRPEAAVHTGPATPGEGLRKPLLTVYVRRQSPESVGMPPIRFSVGSRDVFQDASIFYARHASVNATYALPRSQVQRLLDLF